MKKNKKDLKGIAKEVYRLEMECQKGIDIDDNMRKLDELTSSLSLGMMAEIDELVQEMWRKNKNF